MSQHKHPDMNDSYMGAYLHHILDAAGAAQADGKGLMTVQERIARLGTDNRNHVQAATDWREIVERVRAK